MRYMKKIMPIHVIIKLNKTSDKEQNLEAARENGHYVQRNEE